MVDDEKKEQGPGVPQPDDTRAREDSVICATSRDQVTDELAGATAEHGATGEDSEVPTCTRGRPFPPGKSGNPNGRPKGALGWKSRAARALLDGRLEEIMEKAVDMAMSGNAGMIKQCLTLGLLRREDVVVMEVAKLTSPETCRNTIGTVVDAALAGEVSLGDARKAIALIEQRLTSFHVPPHEKELEARQHQKLMGEMLVRFPIGECFEDDLESVAAFVEHLYAQELPQITHEKLFNSYFDYALEHGNLSKEPTRFLEILFNYLEDMWGVPMKRHWSAA
jgi:hypothetical protein